MPKSQCGFGVVGPDGDGSLEVGRGQLELALLHQHVGQVVVRFGVIGLDRDRLAIASQGFVEPALPPQNIAQIVLRVGQLRIESRGLLEPRQGQVELALLAVDDAQIILHRGDFRIDRKQLLKGGRRFGQPAGTMMGDRQGVKSAVLGWLAWRLGHLRHRAVLAAARRGRSIVARNHRDCNSPASRRRARGRCLPAARSLSADRLGEGDSPILLRG